LRYLGEHPEGHRFNLFAYCLMGNHVHLLIEQAANCPLSRYMQWLQGAYTAFFNRKHQTVGHLFQGRYKAILVDRDAYLLELVRYIHLNPHRAKLEKPEAYLWTSHRQYLGKDQHPIAAVKAEDVLALFSKSKILARKKYEAFMNDPRREAQWSRLRDQREGEVLGDEEFEEMAHERACVRREPGLMMRMDVASLWKRILAREGLTMEPSNKKRSHLMAEVGYLYSMDGRTKQIQIARYFRVRPSTLRMAITRMSARWERGEGSMEKLIEWARRVNSEA